MRVYVRANPLANDQREYDAWTLGLEKFCEYKSPEFYTSDLVMQRWFCSTWLGLITGEIASYCT